ncbi:MAG: DUF2332 domain-containing protein [Pseudomonadota bacterium]
MKTSTDELAERYRLFATQEAKGVSPLYESFANSVAENTSLLQKLLKLPLGKQQPNLLFAAARHAVGLPEGGTDFAAHTLPSWDAVAPVILARSTQTNEPARCACLLPALARIDEPLAIIEVGASAGLCLLIDRYGYDYGSARLTPPNSDAPVFQCRASASTPVPENYPQIVWRAGIDVNPLSVTNDDDMQWLKTLVWPEQVERLSKLESAIAIARQNPPTVHSGDLLMDIEAMAAEAPSDARLVIFHTAVLNYVPLATRRQFAALARDIGAEWIANEGVRVLPDIAGLDEFEHRSGAFVLSHNGQPLARTGPHGQFVDWL